MLNIALIAVDERSLVLSLQKAALCFFLFAIVTNY
jgi:hypothetical protein